MRDSRCDLIRKRFDNDREEIQVVDEPSELPVNYFDSLMEFEVLEHVPEDREVLSKWPEHLKSGGVFMDSVPAHQRKFGRSDEIIGPIRRYERQQMKKLLGSVVFLGIKIVSCRYSIAGLNITLSNRIVFEGKSYVLLDQGQKIILRARANRLSIKKVISLVSEHMIQSFCFLSPRSWRRADRCCEKSMIIIQCSVGWGKK